MTQALAAILLGLYVTQLIIAPVVKKSSDAIRVWLRVGEVTGVVAVLLAILTLA